MGLVVDKISTSLASTSISPVAMSGLAAPERTSTMPLTCTTYSKRTSFAAASASGGHRSSRVICTVP